MRIFFYPDYTSTNLYQTQIYSAFEESDIINSGSIDDAINYLQHGSEVCVFHLHWPEPIFGGAKSYHDYNLRALHFIEKINRFRSLGGVFVWTVHNLLPHDKDRKERQDQFQRQMSKLCDVIHVHSEAAAHQFETRYAVNPGRIFVAPHGNYVGWYTDPIVDAKSVCGYSDEQFVFGFVGQIRPYKGVDRLIDAFQAVKSTRDHAHLFVAGKPVHPTPPGRMATLQKVVPGLKVLEGFVSNDDLPNYISACDVIVLPYTDIFTSGSVMLAASFGKAVVLPDLPTLRDAAAAGFCWTYDPLNEAALEAILLKAIDATDEERRTKSEAALRYAQANDWSRISDALRKRIIETTAIMGDVIDIAGHEVCVAKRVTVNPEDDAVGVIIVNHRSFDDVDELLAELPPVVAGRLLLPVLVDNSELACESRKLLGVATSHAAVLIPTVNGGYAAGNNIGMEFAFKDLGCVSCVILNPDVLIGRRSLETLVRESLREKDRIVGPVVLKDNNHVVASAGVRVESRRGSVNIRHVSEKSKLDDIGIKPYTVDSLHGCALALSKEAYLAAGPIPEDFFLYFEETQWMIEARKFDVTPKVVPTATVIHKQKSHNDGLPSTAYFYYFIRSNFRFWIRLGKSIEEIERSLAASFIAPWLSKLRKRGTYIARFYERLIRVAIEDGIADVAGRIDVYERLASSLDDEVVGFFDRLKNRTVTGWVAPKPSRDRRGASDSDYQVIVIVDDSPVCIGCADIDRDDVNKEGHSDGKGFSIDLPVHLFTDSLRSVRVLAGPRCQQLSRPGEAAQISDPHQVWFPKAALTKSKPKITGRIDGLKNGRIIGWLLDSENLSVPMHATLRLGGREIGSGLAIVKRPDVGAIYNGYEHHGFEIVVPNDMLYEDQLEVELFDTGSSKSVSKREIKLPSFNNEYDIAFSPRRFFEWSYTHLQSPDGGYERSVELRHFFAQCADAFERLGLTSSNRPMVSIIMPAYNRADIIEYAVESVMVQTYTDFELIIIDDGSTDNTVSVVEALVGRFGGKMKLIALPHNMGVSAARNAGLSVAQGDIITYLDSDNQWYPYTLACYVAAFSMHPEASCVYGGQEIYFGQTNAAERRRIRAAPYNRFIIEGQNYIDLNVFAHRRDCLDRYGTFCEEMHRLVDWDLISRYTMDKPPVFVPVLLNKYYMGAVDNQITATEDFARNRLILEHEREKKLPAAQKDCDTIAPNEARPVCNASDELIFLVRAGDQVSFDRWRRVNAVWLADIKASLIWWCTAHSSDNSELSKSTSIVVPADYKSTTASGEVVIVESDMVVSPDWLQFVRRHNDRDRPLGIMGRIVDNRSVSDCETPVEFIERCVAPFVTTWGWQRAYHGAVLSRVTPVDTFVWLSPVVGTMVLAALFKGGDQDIDKILNTATGYPFGEYMYLDTIRVVRR